MNYKENPTLKQPPLYKIEKSIKLRDMDEQNALQEALRVAFGSDDNSLEAEVGLAEIEQVKIIKAKDGPKEIREKVNAIVYRILSTEKAHAISAAAHILLSQNMANLPATACRTECAATEEIKAVFALIAQELAEIVQINHKRSVRVHPAQESHEPGHTQYAASVDANISIKPMFPADNAALEEMIRKIMHV